MAAPQSLKSNGALYFPNWTPPILSLLPFHSTWCNYYLLLALEIFRNLVSFEDIRMIEESTWFVQSSSRTGKQARMTACPCSPFANDLGKLTQMLINFKRVWNKWPRKQWSKFSFYPNYSHYKFSSPVLKCVPFQLNFFFYTTSFHVQIASPNDTTGWAGTGSKADCVHFFPGPYLVTSGC